MAGDLGVMAKHRNSLFLFHNPSFKRSSSLAVVSTAVDATDFVHCVRLWRSNFSWAFGRGNKLFTVLNGLKATFICCYLKIRQILSEVPCTWGSTTKPLDGRSVGSFDSDLSQLLMKEGGQLNCLAVQPWLASFPRVSLSVLMVCSVPCVAIWLQISYGTWGGENWNRDSGLCGLAFFRLRTSPCGDSV